MDVWKYFDYLLVYSDVIYLCLVGRLVKIEIVSLLGGWLMIYLKVFDDLFCDKLLSVLSKGKFIWFIII